MANKTVTNSAIPPYEMTPLGEIPQIAARMRNTFRSNKTKNVEYRLVQLRRLYWGFKDYKQALLDALKLDLNKSPHDASVTEVDWVIADCMYCIKHLEEWVKDDKNVDVALSYAMLKPRIKKEPLGPALIIGAYNFPVNLNMCPMIGAIAAGCTCVLKPSESAPATAMVLAEIIAKYLDPEAYACVNGRIPESTALLNEKWEKIFYTGGVNVAKIISKKAAETLTPVTLELGGKNPAFVSKNADVALAARRLLWGKTVNAGQVCISHNYVLCHREVVDSFIKMLNITFNEFFPQGAKASPDLARVVNTTQFDRMKKMLDNTKGKIVMGGEMDRDELFIAPTAVLVDSADDSMVQEESFGPIWAILPYDDLDEAIKLVNNVDSTPLSLVTFGSKVENEKVLNHVTSGGASINDSFMHASVSTLPFGGVGQSGTGAYRGKASFDCFTHNRTVVETPGWMDKLLSVRYMPYKAADLRRFQWMNAEKPDFDRNGKKIRGVGYWVCMIAGLGGSSAKGALARWLVVLASAYFAVDGSHLKGLNLKEKLGL